MGRDNLLRHQHAYLIPIAVLGHSKVIKLKMLFSEKKYYKYSNYKLNAQTINILD